MLLRDVTLENFMSYEYARIPLKPGLNVVCGPNGAGKSSILLGISVAMGQAYTERSRRLADLVRWGKDIARVSISFDNAPTSTGKRPFPSIHANTVRLSRYIRRDGTYWFEVNGREVSKAEVEEMLKGVGLNPNNMLIVMHQGMVEEFIVLNPQSKLRMLEDAIGFSEYRLKLQESKDKLAKVLSEEREVQALMAKAEETLNYWKEEYEKLSTVMELKARINGLELELAWSKALGKEERVKSLQALLQRKEERVKLLLERLEKLDGEVVKSRERLSSTRVKLKESFYKLVEYEVGRRLIEAERLKQASKRLAEGVEASIEEYASRVAKLKAEVDALEVKLTELIESYAANKARRELVAYQREEVEEELKDLRRTVEREVKEYTALVGEAEKLGLRPSEVRDAQLVLEELKVSKAKLEALGPVSEEAEKVYKSYLKTYEELKEKATKLLENRRLLAEEIEARSATWRKAIQSVIDAVNPAYRELLSRVGAVGNVRLLNPFNVDEAGLELLVGFKGEEPRLLDGYTQSGGERAVAVIAFLLALQGFIKSPFRAVDEFDVHMDARNRELVTEAMVNAVSTDTSSQLLVITPSPILPLKTGAHVVVVQSVRGISKVKLKSF
ncbi:MAG: AAA family ATPase [Candidatus Nezhaarchaeales archaeon]